MKIKKVEMTQDMFKKLFLGVSVLLVVSLVLSIWSVYKLSTLGTPPVETYSPVLQESQALNSYADLRRQINLRLGIGPDSRYFITPDAPEISALVQEIAGDYSDEEFWKDYKRIYRWVMRNIDYSLDSPIPLLPESIDGTIGWGMDFWRTPAETIRDRAGDCEDHSALMASLLLNYNQRRFPIWLVGIRNFKPEPSAHIAVAIPIQNNRLAIWDTSARYYTRFLDVADFGSREIQVTIDLWLKHVEDKVPDAQVYVAFSEDFYQEFSSTEEFIDWAARITSS